MILSFPLPLISFTIAPKVSTWPDKVTSLSVFFPSIVAIKAPLQVLLVEMPKDLNFSSTNWIAFSVFPVGLEIFSNSTKLLII